MIEKSSTAEVQVPSHGKVGRKDKSRALSELAPNGNLSCLLATADTEMALQTHFLHEIGGNIGKLLLYLLMYSPLYCYRL